MTSIWYKLIVQDVDENVDAVEADLVELPSGSFIVHLKEAVKSRWGDRLTCAAPELKVYAAGTPFPIPQNTRPLDPRLKLSDHYEDTTTLIVVAPKPPPVIQQQQQQQQQDLETDSDEVYKTWLLKDMTPGEYNELGPVDRRTLRTQFEQQQQQQQQQQPHTQRLVDTHVNKSTSVFVLFENTDKGPDPIATAFAVSDSLLLTAAHNVVDRKSENDELQSGPVSDTEGEGKGQQGDTVVDNLMIATVVRKSVEGTTTASNARSVTLFKYHYHHDWAFLKLCTGKFDDFIPLAMTRGELPARGTLEKLYIYHCPVRIFQNARRATAVHVMPKEVSVGTVDDKFLSFQNGGFRGSSGGPYIFRNKAVALHVDSANEAVDFEMLDEEIEEGRRREMTNIDKAMEVAESTVSAHASLGTGLILQARSGLMKVYRGEIRTH